MRQVRITAERATVNGEDVETGATVRLPDGQARTMVGNGLAAYVDAAEADGDAGAPMRTIKPAAPPEGGVTRRTADGWTMGRATEARPVASDSVESEMTAAASARMGRDVAAQLGQPAPGTTDTPPHKPAAARKQSAKRAAGTKAARKRGR